MNITQIQSSHENVTYSDTVENTFENVTVLDVVNINNSDATFFSLPVWLFITMISISTWIIVANSTVLLCLITSRNALKNNVNVQLLSLSLTDLLVGITTIPGILFTIVFQNTKYETCASMAYLYTFSQSATLCHTLRIAVNRLLAIKRKTNVEASFTTIVLQILAVWGCCLLFSGVHLLSFARFGETVERCSTVYLFGDNELVANGSLFIPLLVPPQLCTNIIYAYLIIFIRKRSRLVGVLKAAPKQTTNVSAPATSSRKQESHLSKSKTLGNSQATRFVSVDTIGYASSSSTAKTMVQSITQDSQVGPSTASESKCKENNAKTMVQSIKQEPQAGPSTASESQCKEDFAKTMVQSITREPEAGPSTASESQCKEDNAKTMVQSITREPLAGPSTESESKCKEDNAITMVQSITREPEAGPSTASESKWKAENAKTMVQSITREPETGPSTASESKCKEDNHANRTVRTPAVNTHASGGNKIGSNQTNNSQVGWEKQKRAMVTFGILLMSMNIFMTPFDFIVIIEWVTGTLPRGVRFLLATMAMLNSAFNPLINIWRIRPFRLIMKENLKKIYEFLRCSRT